jgi:hypothetical protein
LSPGRVRVLTYAQSVYAIKVACTGDNKEATFFLNTVDTHRNQRKGGTQMKIYKVQDFVVKGKEVFVGLEDSKSTWKIAVGCERMLIHQVSMEAKYPALIGYLRNRFPECAIT